jgi:hypothetical protein
VTAFFRFPHTPHLAWLGSGLPRDDKVLTPDEARAFLNHDLLVEEKVDGANLGLSLDADGELQAQNRGSILARGNAAPQFKPLFEWLAPRSEAIAEALFPDLMLFGEWCYARHSVAYTELPDWFLAFDVFDRASGLFWSASARDELVRRLGLVGVPVAARGRFDLAGLQRLLGPSQLADAPAEGLYLRWDAAGHLGGRAKLVRAEFTQQLGPHWSGRALERNQRQTQAQWGAWTPAGMGATGDPAAAVSQPPHPNGPRSD